MIESVELESLLDPRSHPLRHVRDAEALGERAREGGLAGARRAGEREPRSARR
jgi:hypothetical protein